MTDVQMYQTGAYVSDGHGLFEVTRVRKEGPAMPKQRQRITLESCATGDDSDVLDKEFDKKFTFVCQRLTDEELYLRYKAVGKEYTPEPRPKPKSYAEELAEKLATKRKPKLLCP